MNVNELLELRKERGERIANTSQIVRSEKGWLVPSQSTTGKYLVRFRRDEPECSCPDFETRHIKCKHIFAVEMTITKQIDQEGNVIVTKKVTYSQNWTAYDKSQTQQKELFMKLLNDLCKLIPEPEYVFGRPRLSLQDMVFASALKIFTTFSLRRFTTDMKTAKENGYIDKVPYYSSVARCMENPDLTPIIEQLIKISGLPLKSIETNFAIDSSGFSVNRYGRWFNFRYRKDKEYREWLKAHIMVGVKTGIITSFQITEGNSADNPLLPEMVSQTAETFTIQEVVADKGYSSRANLETIDKIGGTAYIPFKTNTTGKADGSMLWSKMYHYFMYKHDEFLQHYHQRSNVETVFHMIKSKFGSAIRSRTAIAQKNELLLKILCHNICVVIQEMNELGIEPNFFVDNRL
jgi:transposase